MMLIHRFIPRPTAVPLLASAAFTRKKLHNSTYTTSSFAIPSILSFSSFSACRPLLLSSPGPVCSSKTSLDLPKVVVSEAELDGQLESEDDDEFGSGELESEDDDEFGSGVVSEGLEEVLERNVDTIPNNKESTGKLPNLTIKEKKELASYAHSLGKKLKSQQVGKSGVTDNVITALIETLEANELLKLKIHNNCPGEMEDVVKHLAEGTGSVIVGQIGRTIILYRPSLSKLKAEEKKLANRRVFIRKPSTFKLPQSKGLVPSKPSGHGRRGSSRFGY